MVRFSVQNIKRDPKIRTALLASDRKACSTTTLGTVGNGCTENSCRCTNQTRSYLGTCNCPRYRPISPTATRESRSFFRNFLRVHVNVLGFGFYFLFQNDQNQKSLTGFFFHAHVAAIAAANVRTQFSLLVRRVHVQQVSVLRFGYFDFPRVRWHLIEI